MPFSTYVEELKVFAGAEVAVVKAVEPLVVEVLIVEVSVIEGSIGSPDSARAGPSVTSLGCRSQGLVWLLRFRNESRLLRSPITERVFLVFP